jgi:Lysylphosphatidylglycerol synthase TM region
MGLCGRSDVKAEGTGDSRTGGGAKGVVAPEGRSTVAVVALSVVGAGLLGYLLVTLGVARIAAQLASLATVLPAVLVLTGTKYLLQAAGWRVALPLEQRPSWRESIRSTMAGDALGYLTWAGPFTGEPVRALLIRRTVPLIEGIAVGAAERAMYHATATGLVWLVFLGLLSRAHPLAALGGVMASLLGVVLLFRLVRRHDAEHVNGHSGQSPSGSRRRGLQVLDALVRLWATRRQAFPVMALLCCVQHGLLVAEAYLMLGTLGSSPTLQTVLVFEAASKIVNTAGLIVPARVGIAEGGSALLADALGFAASHGLSLALMRRVRALIWTGVGLVLLPVQEARARSRA